MQSSHLYYWTIINLLSTVNNSEQIVSGLYNKPLHTPPDPLYKRYACIAGKRPVAVAKQEAPEKYCPVAASHAIKFAFAEVCCGDERVVYKGKKKKYCGVTFLEKPCRETGYIFLTLIVL